MHWSARYFSGSCDGVPIDMVRQYQEQNPLRLIVPVAVTELEATD